MGSSLVLLLGLALACEAGPEVEFVDWPQLGPAVRSLVVGIRRGEELGPLWVHAADSPPTLELDDSASVLLLGYAQAPESLGHGELDPSSPHLGCELSFPRRVLRAEAPALAFRDAELRADEKARLDGPRRCLGCLDFRVEQLGPTGLDRGPLLRLPSGAAVLPIRTSNPAERRLVRIAPDGSTEALEGCEGGLGYHSTTPEDAATWWAGAADGWLERLVFDEDARRCTVTLSTQTPDRPGLARGALFAISASRAEGRVEVLVASNTGRLDHFAEDAGWTHVLEVPLPSNFTSGEVGVLHLSADEAVASFGADRLVFWRRGAPPQTRVANLGPPLDPFRPPWITSLGLTSTGLWVGDSEGRVSAWREDGNVQALGLPQELGDVGVILPRGRGLVALTEGGRVLQVNDGGEACANVPLILGGFRAVPRHAFVEPDGSMFVADAISAGSQRYGAWLWPK